MAITRLPQAEKQNICDDVLDRAKAEVDFSDRLYDVLLEFQNTGRVNRKTRLGSLGNIGDLNGRFSALFNAIWDDALNVTARGVKTSTRTNKVKESEPVEAAVG